MDTPQILLFPEIYKSRFDFSIKQKNKYYRNLKES